MKKTRYMPLIIPGLLLLTASGVFAKSSTNALLVATRVLPALSKSIHYNSPTLSITADDIKRGYVDIGDATVLEVRTNSRDGYSISLEKTGTSFKEVWVSDGVRTVIFRGSGGMMHQATLSLNTMEIKRLSYRFILSDKIIPGTYSWPLIIDIFI